MQGPGGDPVKFHDRWMYYRSKGLDMGRNQYSGVLTPELAAALGRMHDALIVQEVMGENRIPIRIKLEVPPELEPILLDALKS